MKCFKLCYIYDGWGIRTKRVWARTFQGAKDKLRKQSKGKATCISMA